ncbi:hypothetical protein Tco_1411769 [Tanacetum coccineum]
MHTFRGEQQQSSVSSSEPNPLAMVVHLAEVEHVAEEPTPKRLKVMVEIPKPIPMNSIGPVVFNIVPYEQFKTNLFNSGQPKHSSTVHPTMLRIPLLSKTNKAKIIPTPFDTYLRLIMAFMEQGGSTPNLSELKNFRAADEPSMTIQEATQLMEEEKRLANIKKANEERKWALEKTIVEYKECMEKRDDPLPVTSFKLKVLRINNRVELHALASKRTGKYNNQLMKNLAAKFKWVEETAKKLDIPSRY